MRIPLLYMFLAVALLLPGQALAQQQQPGAPIDQFYMNATKPMDNPDNPSEQDNEAFKRARMEETWRRDKARYMDIHDRHAKGLHPLKLRIKASNILLMAELSQENVNNQNVDQIVDEISRLHSELLRGGVALITELRQAGYPVHKISHKLLMGHGKDKKKSKEKDKDRHGWKDKEGWKDQDGKYRDCDCPGRGPDTGMYDLYDEEEFDDLAMEDEEQPEVMPNY